MKIDWQNLDIKIIAEMVSSHLLKYDIDAVLVGGACVSIYSHNKYLSYDIDYVTESSLKDITKAMTALGFERTNGRLFERPDCKFMVDFIPPPIAVGNDPVKKFNTLESKNGVLQILTPTDCVKDRLSAFYHWNDHQSLEQALMVANKQISKIDFNDIQEWSIHENSVAKYQIFAKRMKLRAK